MSLDKAICLCTSAYSHQLDHLAPLAHILDIPLVLTDPILYKQSLHFYPFTKNRYLPERSCSLEFISKNYDVLFVSCKHWAQDLALSIRELFNKSLRCCYCPHGNSDKGWINPDSDLLKYQDLSLVYGNHMKEMLKQRGILDTLKGIVTTGNYRFNYYLKHKSFYDHLIAQEVFSKFHTQQKTLLYAPTWKDPEDSSSFFDICTPLIEQLPKNYNLLIKLHPNLENDDPARVYHIIGKYEDRPNIVFLSQYPPVYPILDRIDMYLGDFSSVGYDFLCFNRPMFFFNPKNRSKDLGLSLFHCGQEIPIEAYQDLYGFIHHTMGIQKGLTSLRESTYYHTFEKTVSFHGIKEDILHILSTTSPLY